MIVLLSFSSALARSAFRRAAGGSISTLPSRRCCRCTGLAPRPASWTP